MSARQQPSGVQGAFRARDRERINHLEPANLKAAADWLNTFNCFRDARGTRRW
jgi:hypothetical protein